MGCTPHQTVPNPKETALIRIFSVAALQSCTQNRDEAGCLKNEIFPHTTIAAGAFILPKGIEDRTFFNLFGSVTTTNSHGLLFIAEGAAMAAFSNVINFSFSTTLSWYCRILRRA
jgi:hypothetical protein